MKSQGVAAVLVERRMTAEADVSVAAVERPRRRVIGRDFQTYGAPTHAAPDLLDGAQQHRTETEASRSLVHRQGVDAQMAGVAPDAHNDAAEKPRSTVMTRTRRVAAASEYCRARRDSRSISKA